ncbi:MAG: hypothetical protein JWO13_2398 [Acidobacteriales bacterium]|nr:hypothetical protein [Terriglobales bacterium]
MRFTSAEEDFVVNTLSSIPHTMEKLSFMLNICEDSGEFVHWGLERLYGTNSARSALRQAYCSILRDVLKTPAQDLWNEIDVLCADTEGRSKEEFLGTLRDGATKLKRGVQTDDLHLRFTLDGLLEAAKSRRASQNA